MSDWNALNERGKRSYVRYLREARGRSETTIKHALYAIAGYERFTAMADFKTFNSDCAVEYRKHLLADGGRRRAEQSSRATIHSKLQGLRVFFRWLACEQGFAKSLDVRDAEYFNLSARDAKIAVTRRPSEGPTLEQMRAAIFALPQSSDVERRNRALLALVLLTGIRVTALISLRLKHVRADGSGLIRTRVKS